MLRIATLLGLVVAVPAARAQDVVSQAPPEMDSAFDVIDPRPDDNVVRLGVQLDLVPDIALLPLDFAGALTWRPPELAHLSDAARVRPQLSVRVRSPAAGTEEGVAYRTATSGPELALEGAYTVEGRIGGSFWAFARLEGLVGLQQASVSDQAMPDAAERLMTAGVASAGPRVGLVAGPVLISADLMWHTAWYGTETFQEFDRELGDGPFFGLAMMLRLSSQVFVHARVLPLVDDPLPEHRWTVGLSASFDPLRPVPEGVSRGDDYRLHWHYPRVRPVEYVIGFGLPVVFRLIDHNTHDAAAARWSGDNFFDDAIESLIGENSHRTRDGFNHASDVTWYASMAYPFIDTVLVALIADGNPDVAWQMTALNIQAMAVNGFVTLLTIRAAARTRPKTEQCLEAGGTPEDCRSTDLRSFPSGHTAGSFTGAGLACAHHLGLDLYGGGAPDIAACVAALTVAAGTGVFRISADKHHALDVLAGAAIGLGAGWLMPWALHYRIDLGTDDAEVALMPWGDPDGALGLGALGRF